MISKTDIEIKGKKFAVFSYARLEGRGEGRGAVIVSMCAQDRATSAVGYLGQAQLEFDCLDALAHLVEHINDHVKSMFPSVTIPEKRTIIAAPAGFKPE